MNLALQFQNVAEKNNKEIKKMNTVIIGRED